MKKIALILAFFALTFTACENDVKILRRLNENEASIIPYQKGNTITYVDHNRDTVRLTVEKDEIVELNESMAFMYIDDSKYVEPLTDCYGRVVSMYDNVYDNATLTLVAMPDSLLGVKMTRKVVGAKPEKMKVQEVIDLKKTHADTITVGGVTYNDVYISRNPRIVYSCTGGLLLLKTDECVYEKLP